MLVTKLETVNKQKVRVFVNGKFAFVLYKGELSRFHIKENEEIEENIVDIIKKDILLKRAKLRALHLLNEMSRTEKQLMDKLRQSEYPEDIIDEAMAYVKSFGYINDENFAINFIESRSSKYSKKEIYYKLLEKGVDSEIIEYAMEEAYSENATLEAIQKILLKKHYLERCEDQKEKTKIIAYLIRKGFSYGEVSQAINELE